MKEINSSVTTQRTDVEKQHPFRLQHSDQKRDNIVRVITANWSSIRVKHTELTWGNKKSVRVATPLTNVEVLVRDATQRTRRGRISSGYNTGNKNNSGNNAANQYAETKSVRVKNLRENMRRRKQRRKWVQSRTVGVGGPVLTGNWSRWEVRSNQ